MFECEGCKLTFVKALRWRKVEVVNFLMEHGVFRGTLGCPKCEDITLNRENLEFRFQKMVAKGHKKKKPCNIRISGWVGSFFDSRYQT